MLGRTRGVALTAMIAFVMLAIGCGGDGDDGASAGTEAPVTKEQYVKKGETICRNVPIRYRERLNSMPVQQRTNPRQSVPKAAIPPLRQAIEEFEKLKVPEGEEGKAAAIVKALDKAADGLEKNPFGELAGPNSSFAEFNKLTKEYGIKLCSTL